MNFWCKSGINYLFLISCEGETWAVMWVLPPAGWAHLYWCDHCITNSINNDENWFYIIQMIPVPPSLAHLWFSLKSLIRQCGNTSKCFQLNLMILDYNGLFSVCTGLFDGNSKLQTPRCGRPCIWYWTHFTLKTIKAAVNRFLWHSCISELCARPGVRQDAASPKSRRSVAPFQEIRGWSAKGPESIRPLRERIDQALIQT